ncbi:MAG: hypothetical protein FJ098_09865, partial [Deltaproteobacteria bacterium]|nr:hypothetical protein [Deltaproteobacteria bacterium]
KPLVTFLPFLLLAGCPLFDKPSSGGGGGGGILPEEVVEGDGLSIDDPQGLAATFLEAAAACGWQSGNTVPGGWQPVTVSTDGCTQWIPSSWLILGQAGAAAFAPDTSLRTYAFTLSDPLAGVTVEDAGAALDHVVAAIGGQMADGEPSLLWRHLSTSGALEMADGVFAFFRDEEPLVGAIRIHFGGCAGGACHALAMGYWLPVADLDTSLCEVRLVDASFRCPGQGDCVPPLCNTWCIQGGGEDGSCAGGGCGCREE